MSLRRRRADFDRIFDRTGTVAPPRWRDRIGETAALVRELSRYRQGLPVPAGLARGDGHAVLVIPGLFSSDELIRGFRIALTRLGYEAEGWGAGFNLGPTAAAWRMTEDRLVALAERSGGKVSLVGHSLGGVLGRALATEHPDLVRRVITVCSPFRLPTATALEPFYRVLARWHVEPELLLSRLAEPPPVPTTAVYAPRDGVVAWQSCLDDPKTERDNIAVDGAHTTMMWNPETIRIVAERLALPLEMPKSAATRSR